MEAASAQNNAKRQPNKKKQPKTWKWNVKIHWHWHVSGEAYNLSFSITRKVIERWLASYTQRIQDVNFFTFHGGHKISVLCALNHNHCRWIENRKGNDLFFKCVFKSLYSSKRTRNNMMDNRHQLNSVASVDVGYSASDIDFLRVLNPYWCQWVREQPWESCFFSYVA